jgi:hypothetical protein
LQLSGLFLKFEMGRLVLLRQAGQIERFDDKSLGPGERSRDAVHDLG